MVNNIKELLNQIIDDFWKKNPPTGNIFAAPVTAYSITVPAVTPVVTSVQIYDPSSPRLDILNFLYENLKQIYGPNLQLGLVPYILNKKGYYTNKVEEIEVLDAPLNVLDGDPALFFNRFRNTVKNYFIYDTEIGLSSKIEYSHKDPNKPKETFHIGMLDFLTTEEQLIKLHMRKLKEYNQLDNAILVKSGNSYHGYFLHCMNSKQRFNFLCSALMLCPKHIDPAWVGFQLQNEFSILRISNNNRGPAFVPRVVEAFF